MKPRTLRFFCELDETELSDVATEATWRQLQRLGAGVTLAIKDFSPARAAFIRRLTEHGVPVGAWVVLPPTQGYFATPHNHAQVEAQGLELMRWARAEGLSFEALGLDLEPHRADLEALMRAPVRGLLSRVLRRPSRPDGARAAWAQVARRLTETGLRLESYVFPMLYDDRLAGRERFARWLGFVDVPTEREVLMLYSSVLGAAGYGVLASYARSKPRAIGVGSTGGGIDPFPKLSFAHLTRDLSIAASACDDVSIFSLEGCVRRDQLAPLIDFDWAGPVLPSPVRHFVDLARVALR